MNLIERSPYAPIPPLQPSTPCVSIVGNDICLRESLASLISNAGWQMRSFASAQVFLSHAGESVPTCLILDLWLPDMSALDLQQAIEPAKRPPSSQAGVHSAAPAVTPPASAAGSSAPPPML
jgi:DNA-binding NtrC family response regulator